MRRRVWKQNELFHLQVRKFRRAVLLGSHRLEHKLDLSELFIMNTTNITESLHEYLYIERQSFKAHSIDLILAVHNITI